MSDSFNMTGRVALITGAGRGIGLAMARIFASHGAGVAIQDIEIDVAQAEAKSLTEQGHRAIAIGGDASQLEAYPAMVEQVASQLGPIDVLVNNAGIQDSLPFLEWEMDKAARILNTNVLGAMRLCQLVLPGMVERNWGRILNIGSIQGQTGYAHMLPYSASKAAINNLTTALAKSYARHNVLVNAILPGWYDTHRNRVEMADTERRKHGEKFIPIQRIGKPDDCASLALLLCSDANTYIVGQTIYVDGGMSL